MKKEIIEKIDKAGSLSDVIKEMEKGIGKELSSLKDYLKIELKAGKYAGITYETSITERISRTIDVKKLMKLLTKKQLNECLEVSITKAKELLTPKQLDSVAIEGEPTKAISFKKLK